MTNAISAVSFNPASRPLPVNPPQPVAPKPPTEDAAQVVNQPMTPSAQETAPSNPPPPPPTQTENNEQTAPGATNFGGQTQKQIVNLVA